MSLLSLVDETKTLVSAAYQLAVTIQNAKVLYEEVTRRAGDIKDDLLFFTNILERLGGLSSQMAAADEIFLTHSIKSAKSVVENIKTTLEEVVRDRNLFQKLMFDSKLIQTRLNTDYQRLHDLCNTILSSIAVLNKITPMVLTMPDIKKQFASVPKVEVSFFDFIINKDTPKSVLTIATDEFNSNRYMYYIKVTNEQFFVSHHLRTWLGSSPKTFILPDLVKNFPQNWQYNKDSSPHGSNFNLNLAPLAPMINIAASNIRKELAFTEYYMPSHYICGLAFTKSCMYIATEHTVTIVLLKTKRTLREYGTESDGPNGFKQISSIYIPIKDSNSLYIVDRGQNAVHKYRIDDNNHCFEYIRDYKIIPAHNETCHLVSCTVIRDTLYVSDKANHCLHIFRVNGERQSHCFKDNSVNPFSPGSLCADEDHLYVANCSTEDPIILVFNIDCQPIHWFRNDNFEEILAIDIDLNLRHLYVLTRRTTIELPGGKLKKQPLILSIDGSQAKELN